MFAILALVAFLLRLFHAPQIGFIDWLMLGFVFVAAHLAWDARLPWTRRS